MQPWCAAVKDMCRAKGCLCEASHSSSGYAAFEREFVESFVDGHDIFGVLPTAYMERAHVMLAFRFSLKAKGPKHYCSCDTSCGYDFLSKPRDTSIIVVVTPLVAMIFSQSQGTQALL